MGCRCPGKKSREAVEKKGVVEIVRVSVEEKYAGPVPKMSGLHERKPGVFKGGTNQAEATGPPIMCATC